MGTSSAFFPSSSLLLELELSFSPAIHFRGLQQIVTMASVLTFLGLRSDSSVLPPQSLAGHYLFANFLFTYGILQPRFLKIALNFDNNVMPRQDVPARGEDAVRAGKITRQQLDMIKRNEAANANAIENFAGFGAAMVWAQVSGVSNTEINTAGLVYTIARLVYAANYLVVETEQWSWIRTIAWWTGNITVLRLFWSGASAIGKTIH